MYLLIRYPGGVIAEGVVLANGKDLLRVITPGFPDTLEMKRTGARWSTCRGEVVEIDFLMSDERQSHTLLANMTGCAAAASA